MHVGCTKHLTVGVFEGLQIVARQPQVVDRQTIGVESVQDLAVANTDRVAPRVRIFFGRRRVIRVSLHHAASFDIKVLAAQA